MDNALQQARTPRADRTAWWLRFAYRLTAAGVLALIIFSLMSAFDLAHIAWPPDWLLGSVALILTAISHRLWEESRLAEQSMEPTWP